MKTDRRQLLPFLAIAAAVLVAADRLVYTPLELLWKTRAENIAELRANVAQGASLLRREQAIHHRWEQMLKNAWPNNPSLSEQQMLKACESWSRQSRAVVTSITPQWKHDAEDYMTLQCRVDAAGDLGALSRFICELEKDPRALKLEMLEIGAHDSEGRQMTLALQISGLVLLPAKP